MEPSLARGTGCEWETDWRAALREWHIATGWACARELASSRAHPAERAIADGLREPRRQDFLLGRLAAHRALEALGGAPGPILRAGRLPCFPEGVHGSISHSCGTGAAAVIQSSNARGIGIDLELRRLPLAAAHLVCDGVEREWVSSVPGTLDCELRLTLALSVKESAIKAASAIGLEVGSLRRVRLILDAERIVAVWLEPVGRMEVAVSLGPSAISSCVLIARVD